MSFTDQVVPEDWDLSEEEFLVYDMNYPNILATKDDSKFYNVDEQPKVKTEDSSLYEPYVPYAAQNIQNDSLDIYVNSPADNSCTTRNDNFSQMVPDNFMGGYVSQLQQPYPPSPVYPPLHDGNLYYHNNTRVDQRHLRDDQLTNQEYERRRLRRERNKEAAFRCRTRKRERIEALEREASEIESQNEKVETDIMELKKQIEELRGILEAKKTSTS
jgi:hypothetical protein